MKITSLYTKLRASIMLTLAVLIAAVISVFIDRFLVLVFLAIALVIHLVLTRPLQKKYSNEFVCENLSATVCKILGAAAPKEKNADALTADVLEKSNLMPCGDDTSRPLLCWGISGSSDDMEISVADATIPQRFELAKNGKKRVHFNAGVWTHIVLPSDSGLHFKLLDETSVPTPIRMEYFSGKLTYETASIGDDELAKRMVMYHRKDDTSTPSPKMLKKIKALVDYTPGYVAISISGSILDVFIRGRFLARPVSVSKRPTEQMIAFDPFPELDYIIKIAISTIN
jgi:hypothetical protein